MQPSMLCKSKVIIDTCSDYNYSSFEKDASKEDNNKNVKIKVD